jgi:hypothetical protein
MLITGANIVMATISISISFILFKLIGLTQVQKQTVDNTEAILVSSVFVWLCWIVLRGKMDLSFLRSVATSVILAMLGASIYYGFYAVANFPKSKLINIYDHFAFALLAMPILNFSWILGIFNGFFYWFFVSITRKIKMFVS